MNHDSLAREKITLMEVIFLQGGFFIPDLPEKYFQESCSHFHLRETVDKCNHLVMCKVAAATRSHQFGGIGKFQMQTFLKNFLREVICTPTII